MAKKATLTNITAGHASNSQLNGNFQTINNKLDNTISRDGSTPNTMQADFDMNGNDILNGGTATFSAVEVGGTDFLAAMQTIYDNYINITQNVTVSTSAPSGGVDGDIWFKVSV